jgi:hypothetical protein
MNAAAPSSLCAGIGGESVVRAIVARFHDLLDGDPPHAPLRAIRAVDLGPVRDELTRF